MAPTGDEIVAKFASEVPGKTILITGPSEGGVGAQAAISLAAANPKLLILAGRDKSKIQPVIDRISKSSPDVAVTFMPLDLASQASVREVAKKVNSQIQSLDILINNAGIMAPKNYQTTMEGIELQFGVNHIGHFLLTGLLMEKILAAEKGARIINLSSFGYIMSGIRDDWNFEKEPYNSWLGYGQSKTANILFSSALARKLKDMGVLAFSVNPGRDPIVPLVPKSLEEGSATTLYAALNPRITENSGALFSDCDVFSDLLPHAVEEEDEGRLWALSEKLVGEKSNWV
ncbi:hypothetical protein OIDMADRAFT_44470 [Oidiodendron maius Zn]|uniref:Uncharacterized protein n=1 Tax=Oidiodendron maius (strain Zn) TaxID=913774 RepID=A0A0C3D567_OIDMZ|nr:hypothetical protein OIDMADRAFT_44470 [Oidiodendron maius Zn]